MSLKKALLQAISSSYGTKLQAQATPKPPQANPQIRVAQPPPLHLLSLKPSNRRRSRGACMALGLCRESWKESGDFSGYLCRGAISGGDSFMDFRFQKWNQNIPISFHFHKQILFHFSPIHLWISYFDEFTLTSNFIFWILHISSFCLEKSSFAM